MSSSKRLKKTLKRKFGKALVTATPILNAALGDVLDVSSTTDAVVDRLKPTFNEGVNALLDSTVQYDTVETDDEFSFAGLEIPKQPASGGFVKSAKQISVPRPIGPAPIMVRSTPAMFNATVEKSITALNDRAKVKPVVSAPPADDDPVAAEREFLKNHALLKKRFKYPFINSCRDPTQGVEKEEVDLILDYIKIRARHARAFNITRLLPALDAIEAILKHYLRVEKNLDTRYRFIRYLGEYVSTQLRL